MDADDESFSFEMKRIADNLIDHGLEEEEALETTPKIESPIVYKKDTTNYLKGKMPQEEKIRITRERAGTLSTEIKLTETDRVKADEFYNPDIVQEIYMATSTHSCGLKKLCKKYPHWPTSETIYKWLAIYPNFKELYHQAKRNQVELLTDETLEIADDSHNDEMKNRHGEIIPNNEFINRSRVRIEVRHWMAERLMPKMYGSKTHTEHSGYIDSALKQIPQEQQDKALLAAADALRGKIQDDSESSKE